MEKINFDDNLSQIKMEKAKAAAASLNENWNSSSSFSSAGSYVEGLKKEVQEISNRQPNSFKPSFSLGILETVLALNNTSFVELPEGRIFTEKYINGITIRTISEAILIEGLIQELENYSWETNAKASLSNLKKVYEKNKREIEVVKAIEEINRSAGKGLFSGIVETMKA